MPHLISSTKTHYFKSTLPRLYFGFAAFFLLITLIVVASTRDFRVLVFPIMAIILVGFGLFLFKRFVFDLVDEVYDEGDALIVKNGGREAHPAPRVSQRYGFRCYQPPSGHTYAARAELLRERHHVFSTSARILQVRSKSGRVGPD